MLNYQRVEKSIPLTDEIRYLSLEKHEKYTTLHEFRWDMGQSVGLVDLHPAYVPW